MAVKKQTWLYFFRGLLQEAKLSPYCYVLANHRISDGPARIMVKLICLYHFYNLSRTSVNSLRIGKDKGKFLSKGKATSRGAVSYHIQVADCGGNRTSFVFFRPRMARECERRPFLQDSGLLVPQTRECRNAASRRLGLRRFCSALRPASPGVRQTMRIPRGRVRRLSGRPCVGASLQPPRSHIGRGIQPCGPSRQREADLRVLA